MHIKTLLAGAGALALVSAAVPAAAAVVLSDNFDATAADVLNWTGDTLFTSTSAPGSVDLIGAGGAFDFYPGNGSYVDLDGSTGSGHDPAGELTSNLSFGPGSYTLTFLLGGNARGAAAQTTQVSLGDFTTSFLRNSSDPLASISLHFTTTTAGQLKFTERGPSDNQGNILDNVVLATGGVPEPAAWTLMTIGFGGLGGMLRTRRRRAAMAAIA